MLNTRSILRFFIFASLFASSFGWWFSDKNSGDWDIDFDEDRVTACDTQTFKITTGDGWDGEVHVGQAFPIWPHPVAASYTGFTISVDKSKTEASFYTPNDGYDVGYWFRMSLGTTDDDGNFNEKAHKAFKVVKNPKFEEGSRCGGR
ncbi:hypothetical protein T439DRAFT_357366 [Meredithblackwellia eburnea MCA 4105]